MADILGNLEKLDTGADPTTVDPLDGKDEEDDDEDEDEDKGNALDAIEENDEEAEEDDDYQQDYAGEDYDALGSESGGDDY